MPPARSWTGRPGQQCRGRPRSRHRPPAMMPTLPSMPRGHCSGRTDRHQRDGPGHRAGLNAAFTRRGSRKVRGENCPQGHLDPAFSNPAREPPDPAFLHAPFAFRATLEQCRHLPQRGLMADDHGCGGRVRPAGGIEYVGADAPTPMAGVSVYLPSASAVCWHRVAGLQRILVPFGSRESSHSAMFFACRMPFPVNSRVESGEPSRASACRHRINSIDRLRRHESPAICLKGLPRAHMEGVCAGRGVSATGLAGPMTLG